MGVKELLRDQRAAWEQVLRTDLSRWLVWIGSSYSPYSALLRLSLGALRRSGHNSCVKAPRVRLIAREWNVSIKEAYALCKLAGVEPAQMVGGCPYCKKAVRKLDLAALAECEDERPEHDGEYCDDR